MCAFDDIEANVFEQVLKTRIVSQNADRLALLTSDEHMGCASRGTGL